MVNELTTDLTAAQVIEVLEAQGDYGSIQDSAPSKRILTEERAVNITAVFLAFFIPMVLFASVYGVLSFSIHYRSPWTAYCFSLIALLVVCLFAWLAWRQLQRGKWDKYADPGWYVFICGCCLVSWLLAMVLGEVNYLRNMRPAYDLDSLNTYVGVDPAMNHGEQLLDAGRVVFTREARLDLRRSMAFVNADTYCVAPISVGAAKLPQYDFWAIGTNCCEAHSRGGGKVAGDYECGEFDNKQAHAGLRLAEDEQRPFYDLAVRQAEALHGLRASTPLFFHWVQDPVAEVQGYHDRGLQYYLLGLFAFFGLLLLSVSIATVLMAHKS